LFITGHVIISGLIGLVVYFIFSPTHAIVIFIAGTFIDIDHFIEVPFRPNINRIISILIFGKGFVKPHITDILFHSWEFLLFIFIILGDSNTLVLMFLIGYASHLLIDTVSNYFLYGTNPLSYFFIYRILRLNYRLKTYENRINMQKDVLEQSNYHCSVCGIEHSTEVHMKKFAYGHESIDQYIAICHSCHIKKHIPLHILNLVNRIKS